MKILVIGISGLLGSELARELSFKHEITGISKNSAGSIHKTIALDITDPEKTYETVSKINPDIVINAAAYSNVDECEKNPDTAYKINALGVRNICAACQRFDTILVHISTDYVFSGKNTPETGYCEFDSPDPLSVYAKSKTAGESYVKDLLGKYFIIRTSWLFGSKRDNFISSIFNSLKSNKKISQAEDMVSSPTYVADLSAAVSKLIETTMYGIYHLSNSGFASRYQVAAFIAKMLGCPATNIEKIKLKNLKLAAQRPEFSGLNNYIWKLNGFKPLRPWQEAVAEFYSRWRIRQAKKL